MVLRKKRVQKKFQGILFNIHKGVTLFVNFITCAFFIDISDWGFCLKPSNQRFVSQNELFIDVIITNCLNQSVRCLVIPVFAYCKDFCYMPLNSIHHFTKEKADIYYLFQKFVSGLVKSRNYSPKRLFYKPRTLVRVKQTFKKQQFSTDYHYNRIIPQLLRIGNRATVLQIFGTSLKTLRTQGNVLVMSQMQRALCFEFGEL